jgi:choice-of-anchor B domain-containing protein
MMKIKLLIIYIVVSFSYSQESYNAELVGNWFEPNDNYWSELVSDFNDIWGYESDNGTKYALMGGWDGTYIIDISTTPSTPQLVSFVPGSESSHRDIKTHQNFMYVSTEANMPNSELYELGEYYIQPQGIQVIDMTDPWDPVQVNEWDGVVESHNIMEADGYLYVIGSQSILSNDGEVEAWGLDDLIILDLEDPSAPIKVGGWSNGVYIHDVCIYEDVLYGCDLYNDNMYAFDITDKTNPTVISIWPGVSHAHSCWVSEDGETVFTGSETTGGHIMSWDVSDLSNVEFLDEWLPEDGENWSAHNVFVLGDRLYISYYVYGLQVLDISDPSNLELAAFYDTFDQDTESIYNGAWGTYPFFGSENVIISDRRTGLYVVDVEGISDNQIGDINQDADTNIMDIIILVGFVLENADPTELEFLLSDLNGDGALDVLDVIFLVNIILESPS